MLKFLKYTGIVLGSILLIAFVLLGTGVGDAPEPDYTPIVDPVVADEDNGYFLYSQSLEELLGDALETRGGVKDKIAALAPERLEAFYETLNVALDKPYWVKSRVSLFNAWDGLLQNEYTSEILKLRGELAIKNHDLNAFTQTLGTCLLYTSPSPRDS